FRLSESSIEVLKEKIRREARERATSRESVTEKKKRKTGRVRVGSSSSTESERENAPSVLEQLGKKQKEKKRHKPKGTDRTCTTCGISLCDCVDAWLEVGV
ncbi:unnamed protein product, partial [Anisakis simplex]|uniref:PHD-type domain-containing protein n=1 Tax=Anisakis simplex TaxID=6269 RepID=A0A0M3JJE5_ANISI